MGSTKLVKSFGKFPLFLFAALFLGIESFPRGPVQQNSGKCVAVKDCPLLLGILNESGERALQEYDRCEQSPENSDEKHYICPEEDGADDECANCIVPSRCPALSDLVIQKRFEELKQFKTCGFEGLQQLFCCPSQQPKKSLAFTRTVVISTTPTPSPGDPALQNTSSSTFGNTNQARENDNRATLNTLGQVEQNSNSSTTVNNNPPLQNLNSTTLLITNQTQANNDLKTKPNSNPTLLAMVNKNEALPKNDSMRSGLEPDVDERQVEVNLQDQIEADDVLLQFINGIPESAGEIFLKDWKTRCGTPISVKIFGGQDVDDHEYPWLAALGYADGRLNSKPLYLCGGAIISDRHILTAAHCLSQAPMKLVEVRIGHANLLNDWSFAVPVSKEIAHPDFKLRPYPVNDLAIIKLATKLDLGGDKVIPICLPERSTTEQDSVTDDVRYGIVHIAGWGATAVNVSLTNQLQELELTTMSTESCQSSFQKFVPNFHLGKNKICASGPLGSDGCKGDSGGPLMYANPESHRYQVLGITSFGTRACDSSVPAIYTRVTGFLDWIEETIFNDFQN